MKMTKPFWPAELKLTWFRIIRIYWEKKKTCNFHLPTCKETTSIPPATECPKKVADMQCMNQQVCFGRYAHSLRPKAVNTKHTRVVTVFPLSSTAYLRPVEHILNRQHGDYCQHFLAASQMYRHDQHFTQHGFQGEFCHLQKNCFRVPWKASKNLQFSQWSREKLFLLCFLIRTVCIIQDNYIQH